MKTSQFTGRNRTKDDRLVAVADLVVIALIRLRARPKPAEEFSEKVGLDNAGEPRVYVNSLESPGG
jgi:hypothetical protein